MLPELGFAVSPTATKVTQCYPEAIETRLNVTRTNFIKSIVALELLATVLWRHDVNIGSAATQC